LIAIPANCPNASRRVVNDWDCNGSCHLKFFDHPRKPIKSVARLQFAGGHIGQFRENDRRIIHSVGYFKSPVPTKKSIPIEIVAFTESRPVAFPDHADRTLLSARLFPSSRCSASRDSSLHAQSCLIDKDFSALG
jgi:hypothetical protein